MIRIYYIYKIPVDKDGIRSYPDPSSTEERDNVVRFTVNISKYP